MPAMLTGTLGSTDGSNVISPAYYNPAMHPTAVEGKSSRTNQENKRNGLPTVAKINIPGKTKIPLRAPHIKKYRYNYLGRQRGT
jgi:hypothetical protein